MGETKSKIKNPLTSEKIFYKFIENTNNGIRDKRHPLYGNKLDVTVDSFEIGVDRNNVKLQPLDEDEIAFFAQLYGNLDTKLFDVRYKDEHNFWNGKRVRLGKEGLVLDLSNPEDYITDKILLTNKGVIAPSVHEQKKKATYNYVRMSESVEKESNLKSVNSKIEAYKQLSKIESDKFKMAYVATKLTGRNTPISTSIETLKAQVGSILEDKLEMFNKLVSDNLFNEKVFIHKAMMLGVLQNHKGELSYQGRQLAGEGARATLHTAAMYISDPMNQELKYDIEESVKIAKE